LVGSQIRWSPQREALASAAGAIGAPFYLNGMARGGLPHEHPLRMSRSRRFALAHTDAAFVFGTPFDFRVDYGRAGTWAADAKIVQIDLDGSELGRNRRVDVALHADSGQVLVELARAAKTHSRDFSGWVSAVRKEEEQKQASMLAAARSRESPPHPLWVSAEVSRRLRPGDVVVGDGGDFVASAAYVLKLEWPQIWMDPGPLGTLGVGPGYAMAAKLSRIGEGVNIKSTISDPMGTATTVATQYAESLGSLGVAAVGLTAGVAALGAALFELGSHSAEVIAKFDDLADKTGMSVPALSRLSNASHVIGADLGQLTDVVFKLEQRMGENSDTFQKGLSAMGLSTADLKAAGPDKYLELVTAGLQGIADPSARAAAGTEVLGKGYRDVAHALNDLATGLELTKDITPFTEQQAKDLGCQGRSWLETEMPCPLPNRRSFVGMTRERDRSTRSASGQSPAYAQ
jgi:hypothetical protein